MAVAYGAGTQPGLLSLQYPPPLLPKPGKDNVRLKKLLKRTAKKKASAQASQSAAPFFRSSLSPVNEASPDLEHSDHSTPPCTPETPANFYGIQQPPRFTVRPLYQHVASPYPQRAAYGMATRFSPQTIAMPAYSYPQHVTTVSAYSASAYSSGVSPAVRPSPQPAIPKICLSAPPEMTTPLAEVTKPAFSSFAEPHAGLRPAAVVITPQPKPRSPGPTPYPAAGGQAVIRPLTVLTPLVKCKSPRPTFKATEPSRSPKPMFDVPQIRMYTASTSYYETSRTPPVYDTAELTAIGSTVAQNKIPPETKQDLTPGFEVRRGMTHTAQPTLVSIDPQRKTPTSEMKKATTPTTEVNAIIIPAPEIKRATPTFEIKKAAPASEIKRTTPTSEIKKAAPTFEIKKAAPASEIKKAAPTSGIKRTTPTSEIKKAASTSEIKRTTPTSEIKKAASTSEIKRTTPTSEIKKAAPTSEIKRTTPTSEIKKAAPTSEIKRTTPTSEIKRTTPTSEIKKAAPTSEIKRTTPTSEIKKAVPATEAKQITPTPDTRGKTSEFQISRTFVGRPKTPAYHASRAPTPVFEISRPNPLLFAVSPITVEPERSRTPKGDSTVNGLSVSQSVMSTEPKTPESIPNGDIHSDVTPGAKPFITKSKSEPALTSEKIQTASETLTSGSTLPGVTFYSFQRPRTPTYEATRLLSTSPGYKRPKTPTGVSPVAFQRSKTPTHVAQKSGYRGLTPAEYAAHGGIKTYSPAFSMSSSMTSTQEEIIVTKEGSGTLGTPSQELSVKEPSTDMSFVRETTKEVIKPQLSDQKVSETLSVPTIIVSQASETLGTTLTQETSSVSSQVIVKQQETVIKETPKAKPPAAGVKTPEKPREEMPVQEVVKPKAKTPEAKHPLPKGADQDPLKAVRKLLGKDKVQVAEQKTEAKAKADALKEKELVKPVTATGTEVEGSKPSSVAPAAESTGSKDKGKEKKTEPAVKPAVTSAEKKEGDEPLPKAEPLLKVMQKPKGAKLKVSGWSRLKKHMVVEQEEPKFPETETSPLKETIGQDQQDAKKTDDKSSSQDGNQTKDTPKATKMWEAVLFQMFSSKENIMHQIELNKSEMENKEDVKDELKEIPSFAFRLPVLLFSPKFDAKKLKEAASRPVTKISTVFEMGLIGRKGKDEEPKDFNRTARGFAAT